MRCHAQSIVTSSGISSIVHLTRPRYSRMTDERLHRRRKELQRHSVMNKLLWCNLIENQSLRANTHDSL